VAVATALVLGGCSAGLQPEASFPATTVEQMTIASTVLGRSIPVLVFVPRGLSPATLPILFVFHGFGGDETAWFDGHGGDGIHLDGRAQALIDAGRACPAVIVSAFIGNSYGVDSEPASDQWDHGRYATYLLTELLPTVEHVEWGEERRGGGVRYVAGISAGGFGAIHLALTHPALFAGVGALSPAMFVDTPTDRQWLFDGNADANDPMRLVGTADLGALRWYLGDGSSDYGWVRDGAAELSRRLHARGVDAPVQVVPGGHDAGTWRQLASPMLERLLAPPCPRG
jgi:enterochelin esterase-like enzyme